MRLLRLQVENWGCHEQLDIDISSSMHIEGRNGTGKSTLLDAIRFIFSSSARGFQKRIKNGERYSLVRLDLESDGSRVSVEKTIYCDKPSKAVMVSDDVQVADTPSSVHERLGSLISEDILDRLIYIPQGGLTSVLDRLGTKEGKGELDRLFGFERLEKAWEGAGNDIRETEAEVRILSGERAKHPDEAPKSYEKDIKDLEQRLEELKARAKESESYSVKAKQMLKDAGERLSELRREKDRMDGVKKRMHQKDVEIEGHTRELNQLGKRICDLEQIISEIPSMSEKVERISDVKAVRDNLARLDQLRKRLSEMRILDEKRKAYGSLRENASGISEMKSNLKQIEKSLEKETESLANANAELSILAKDYKNLTGVGEMAKCPTCKQEIPKSRIESQIRITAEKIASIDGMKSGFDSKKRMLEKKRDELKESLTKAQGSLMRAESLKFDIERLEEERRGILAQKEGIMMSLQSLGISDPDPEAFEEEYEHLTRTKERLENAQKRVFEKKSLERERDVLLDSLENARGETRILQKELDEMSFDSKNLSQAEKDFEQYTGKYHRAEAMLNGINAEIKHESQNIRFQRERLSEFCEIEAKISKAKHGLGLLRQAREIFHRDKGLARYLRENYVRGLNDLLTGYFKRFNENPRYLEIAFGRDYEIVFRTSEGELDMNQISGGERVQLALAFRLALLDLMSPVRLLILDEPFGSLDEDHRELLGQSLSSVACGGQLIVVTHIPVQTMQLEKRLDLGGY